MIATNNMILHIFHIHTYNYARVMYNKTIQKNIVKKPYTMRNIRLAANDA